MRRRIAAALMTALMLFLLTACGGDAARSAFEDLRASMAGGTAEITALVTAWGRDGTQTEYTLRCASDGAASEVETLAPELISGVKARIEAESAELEYEGLILDAGEVAEGLSPVTALPQLCEAIRTAYVELAWTEGGETVVSLVPEDETGITVRLDEAGRPVSAEFTSRESGRCLMTVRISEFSLN